MSSKCRAAVACLMALAPMLTQAEYRSVLVENNKAWGSAVADYNGDGHDDIFITGHDTRDRIWYWTPQGYVASPFTFVSVDRHDCDAADIDRDGRIDLYCAIGAERGLGDGPKEVWLQGADGSFTLAQQHGAEDPYGRGRIPLFFDFNKDGYPDIYLTNESRGRVDGQINHNHVFVNRADGTARFDEVPTLATGPQGWACAAKGDVNGDGWDDLIVCNLYGLPHVFVNDQAGNFTELATPAAAVKWRHAKLADLNGDGRDDLAVLTISNVLQVWLNSGTGLFYEKVSYKSPFSAIPKALTIGDFNGDGLKDIYVVLVQDGCQETDMDTVRDVVFHGRRGGGFVNLKMPRHYAGCGHLADTLDGRRILLMNGDQDTRGPNVLIDWVPAGKAPTR